MVGRPSAPQRAKRKNGEMGQNSQHHPAGYVKDSVNEATEVLSGMLNTH